ncbi:hypothetical protein UUU_44750 [Klebsiella pneumoniae subsp. pneumoniae DSM 30104 = JCM 1662 = NBRC 14940]|nr:hypothetical protein UUU_44750 [Klebsiella pneumoniae subsp. pneumoniae DSM 30104 = JCM 1662 = NBRC 14940]EMH91396.1 hypothetical protein MTE1_4969 [Klebsiella pneumoniae JHCK1]KFJ78326.1 hypothetical protein DR88_5093 [Klebsiella pneumoniae]
MGINASEKLPVIKHRFTGRAHKNKRREIVCQFRALCND